MVNGHSVVPGTCRFKSFVLGVKKGWAQEIADILCPPDSVALSQGIDVDLTSQLLLRYLSDQN